jgi:hypothetical protein
MNNRKKQLEKLPIKSDIINTIVGIALIVSVVLIFIFPYNQYAILAACISGGLINIMNGLKQRKEPGRKSMSMTLIMMGIIVIFLGFVIIKIV